MLETAMEDSDLTNSYFLNLVSGEVVFFSDYLGLSEEDERLLEEIEGSNDYVAIERIPSYVAYQWMVDFVAEMVAPIDEHAAEKLSMVLNGKGAFRRFEDTLHRVDEQWLQVWYQWRDERLAAFPAPEDIRERRMIETEMIQFMDAAGVPLTNIHQRKEPCVGIELDEEYG